MGFDCSLAARWRVLLTAGLPRFAEEQRVLIALNVHCIPHAVSFREESATERSGRIGALCIMMRREYATDRDY